MAGGIPGGYDLPGGVPPPAKKSGGGNVVIWSLVGCGTLVVLLFVLGALGIWQFGRNNEIGKVFSGAMTVSTCRPGMVNVRSAIDRYRDDHDGKYPPSLSALVPGYLNQTGLACGNDTDSALPMEYTPPDKDAPADTVLVSVRTGDASLIRTQHISYYIRLLKDGSIVMDQIQRTEMAPPGDMPRSMR